MTEANDNQDMPAAAPSPECLRCQAVMVEGFQFDMGYGVIQQAKWVAGSPQRSWISGEVKTAQAKQGVPVTTFRCPACGYLESYALGEG